MISVGDAGLLRRQKDTSVLQRQERTGLFSELVQIDMPYLASNVARWRSRVAKLEIETDLTINDATINCRALPARLRDMSHGIRLDLLIGDLPVTFGIMSDLEFWLGGKEVSVDTLYAMAPDALALVTEHLLTPELERLEWQADAKIQVTNVVPRQRFPLDQAFLRLALQRTDGASAIAYMWSDTPDEAINVLEQSFARKPARDLGNLYAQVAVLGPLTVLSRTQLAKLSVGDVLVPGEGWTRADLRTHILINQDHIAPMRAVDTGLVCEERGEPFSKLLQEFAKDPDMTLDDTQLESTLADPRSLVTVELIRTRLSVSQLQDLQNGDVLDFDIAAIETVRICADGAPIAEAELVQLDDSVGVHITQLL